MNTPVSPQAADLARTTLCRELARLLDSHTSQVRVRTIGPATAPARIAFYAHHDNRWHHAAGDLTSPSLCQAIAAELADLAHHGRGTQFSVRRQTHGDLLDTDLTFPVDQVPAAEHREAFLLANLFRDAHDSGHDRRQQLRHGPVTRAE